MRNKPENQSGSSADAEDSLPDVCCGGGSLLTPPRLWSILPIHALPWSSALRWPDVPCSGCGMDGPEELQSPSFPQISWVSSILDTFERRGEYFRGNSSTGTPFPFCSLGKACSPLISILCGSFSPYPNRSSFILCHLLSTISHEYALSCLLCFHIRKIKLTERHRISRESLL